MFMCSCKKSFALKKDYLKHLRDRLLVNVDHKYPLYCYQPECNNIKDMDSLYQLIQHLLFHEKKSEKLSSFFFTMTI